MSEPQPNGLEHDLARRITYGMPTGEIERQLAAVREGATLPGPRVIVSGTAQILAQSTDASIGSATEYAWRSWFRELRRRNLRPCGWPAEQRTYLATLGLGYVEVDEEQAETLTISVSCEAVPAT